MDEDYDEFEDMYADELEIMNELENEENECPNPVINTPMNPKVKRNLEFRKDEAKIQEISEPTPKTLNESGIDLLPSSSQEVVDNICDDLYLSEDDNMEVPEVYQSVNGRACILPSSYPESRAHKRPRLDPDQLLIDKINEIRNNIEKPTNRNVRRTKHQPPSDNRNGGIHKRIPQGDFMSVTTVSGQRFYLDIEDEGMEANNFDVMKSDKKVCLLSEPYHQLKAAAELELAMMRSRKDQENEATNEVILRELEEQELNENLWVEKYKPRGYLDLLSDECTNRTVLKWLKLWDKVVFGIEPKVKRKEAPNPKDKKRVKYYNKNAPEIIEEFDEHGRPEQKVILLCGPPGVGKTTLAHIIARHAGYNVVEMNASDDRSVDAFKNALENATTMTSVFGVERKPNCLIIDEIDGAPAPSINLLVNLLQGKKTKESKKSKSDKMILRRPIICICNDLYATSLRPLKQIALVIHFPPLQSTKLASRLLSICNHQNVRADLTSLRALCDKTENDIRSCLSVLQFVKNASGELKFSDFEGMSIGQKDYQRSLFTVWNDIFTIPRANKRRVVNPHTLKRTEDGVSNKRVLEVDDTTSLSARFTSILRTSQSCGEYDKLTSGWFENYLNTKFKHTHLEPVRSGLDWATTNDIVQKEIHRNQTWSLMAYLAYSFVAYHFNFATHQKPKLQYPMQYNEVQSRLSKSKSLLCSMISEMPPYTRLFSEESSLVFDTLPHLVVIIQPQLRPVNYHLFSAREKEALSSLVNTMINYNLTYVQERSGEGKYSFILDPNVEEIAFFPDIGHVKPMSYSSRQLVAREIEMEKVRRSERYFNQGEDTPKPVAKSKQSKPAVPNHLQRLPSKSSNTAPTPKIIRKDFFGRPIIESSKQKEDSGKSFLHSDVWFKFKEGYTNAVRRTVSLKNLIGQ